MTNIRKAESGDTRKILSILESGRAYLQSQGLSQWQNGYGPSRHVGENIAKKQGYVLISRDNTMCGYAALVEGVETAYGNIIGGCWDGARDKYITIHSVAIDASFRGKNLAGLFMRGLVDIARGMGYRDIRIDTHPSNVIMQKVISRAGFVFRGTVEYDMPDGERKAYQLKIKNKVKNNRDCCEDGIETAGE